MAGLLMTGRIHVNVFHVCVGLMRLGVKLFVGSVRLLRGFIIMAFGLVL